MGACRTAAMLAICAALSLGACAGDNDPAGEPPTTAPPEPADTRPSTGAEADFPADFVEQVDPICEKAQGEVDKVVGTEVRDRGRVQELAGIFEDTAAELEKLEPPEQNATAYTRFTDAFRDGQDLFSRLDAEVGRGDDAAYQRVTTILDEVDTDIRDLAVEYGFEGCAAD